MGTAQTGNGNAIWVSQAALTFARNKNADNVASFDFISKNTEYGYKSLSQAAGAVIKGPIATERVFLLDQYPFTNEGTTPFRWCEEYKQVT